MPRRAKSISKLKKDLWKLFSKHIRKRDKGYCFTCDRHATGSGYHAGHFIPKSIGSLDLYFDERNVHGQCFRCNIHLSGNWPAYQERMIKKYGQDVVDELMSQRHKVVKWTRKDYLDLIEKYKGM